MEAVSRHSAESLPIERARWREKQRRLPGVLAPALALLFFTIGYFDFWDIFGLRLEVQVALLGILALIGPPIVLKFGGEVFKQPLFLLALSFLVVEMLFPLRQTWLNAVLGMGVTVALLALVFSLGGAYVSQVVKWIIILAIIFALFGIAQFFILLRSPELIEYTINPNYVDYIDGIGGSRTIVDLEGRDFRITHPITLLGMTTGKRPFLGVTTTRVFSFAREPGLLIMYFLLPAVLALTYQGRIKLLAIPLFAMAFLGFTGSVYGSIILALLVFIVFLFARSLRSRRLLYWTPLVITLGGTAAIYGGTLFDEVLFRAFRNDLLLSNLRYVGFLDIYDSAIVRLEQSRNIAPSLNFLGVVTGHIPGATGWVVYGFLKSSLIGGLLTILVLHQIFEAASRYLWLNKGALIAWALLCGIYIQVGLFQQYGFTLPAGFLITALVLERIRWLAREGETARFEQINSRDLESGRKP